MLKFGGLVNLRSKDTLYDRALGWRKQQEEDGIDINTLETQRYHIEVSIAPGALGEKLGRTNVVDLTVDDFNMLWRTLARNGGKRGNGLSLSALKHIRSTLGQVLRKAEQQGKIRQNVVYLSNTIEDLPVGVVRQPKKLVPLMSISLRRSWHWRRKRNHWSSSCSSLGRISEHEWVNSSEHGGWTLTGTPGSCARRCRSGETGRTSSPMAPGPKRRSSPAPG